MNTQTLRARASGSLPRPRATRVTRSFCAANPAGPFPHQGPQTFQASTVGTVASRMRSPVLPIISGTRRDIDGNRTASSVRYPAPSNDTRSPASSPRTIRYASIERAALPSNGRPNASNSARFHPAPSPRVRRPPLISSSVAAIFARIGGCRNAVQATSGPSRIPVVAVAIAASSVNASRGPRSGPSSRYSRWSPTQIESNPTSSAARAMARYSSIGTLRSASGSWIPTRGRGIRRSIRPVPQGDRFGADGLAPWDEPFLQGRRAPPKHLGRPRRSRLPSRPRTANRVADRTTAGSIDGR